MTKWKLVFPLSIHSSWKKYPYISEMNPNHSMNDYANLWSMSLFRRPRRRSCWPWSRRGCYPRSPKSFSRRLSPDSAAQEALGVLVQPSRIWEKSRIHFSFKLKEPFLIGQSSSKIVLEFDWSNGGVKFQSTLRSLFHLVKHSLWI